MTIPKDVITKKGSRPGPTVAIFGGFHGNERAGILTVDRLIRELTPTAGTVHLVYANPPAIGAGTRLVTKNLNRLFSRDRAKTDCFEDKRADELMDLLDTCDALLDLHSYSCRKLPEQAIPFAICDESGHDVVAALDVPVVISGFGDGEEVGSDGYMAGKGKPGVCVELGSIERPDLFLGLGLRVAYAFLGQVGCIDRTESVSPYRQRRLRLSSSYKKLNDDFAFAKEYRSFDRLAAGTVIAIDGGREIITEREALILFPRIDLAVGVEAFLLVEETEV